MNDNSNKVILDLCGGTRSWAKPYIDAGYDVWTVTLPDNDVLDFAENIEFILESYDDLGKVVYGILAAPPCTQFSFARTTPKIPRNLEEGLLIVKACMRIIEKCKIGAYNSGSINNLKFWAMENPRGYLRHLIGLPIFNFNPFEYGDIYNKSTDLWGVFNAPKKKPVKLNIFEKERNYYNNRNLPPIPANYIIPDGAKTLSIRRSITPPGFALAFFKANK